MKMRIVIHSFLFFCVVSIVSAKPRTQTKATPLLTTAERVKFLKEFQGFLQTPVYNIQDMDLFTYKNGENLPEIQPIETPKNAEPCDNDLLLLQSVGKSIKPQGVLAKKNQFVLCTQENHILKEGDVLYAKYKGNTYRITIKIITRNQFILQLNDKERTFQY